MWSLYHEQNQPTELARKRYNTQLKIDELTADCLVHSKTTNDNNNKINSLENEDIYESEYQHDETQFSGSYQIHRLHSLMLSPISEVTETSSSAESTTSLLSPVSRITSPVKEDTINPMVSPPPPQRLISLEDLKYEESEDENVEATATNGNEVCNREDEKRSDVEKITIPEQTNIINFNDVDTIPTVLSDVGHKSQARIDGGEFSVVDTTRDPTADVQINELDGRISSVASLVSESSGVYSADTDDRRVYPVNDVMSPRQIFARKMGEFEEMTKMTGDNDDDNNSFSTLVEESSTNTTEVSENAPVKVSPYTSPNVDKRQFVENWAALHGSRTPENNGMENPSLDSHGGSVSNLLGLTYTTKPTEERVCSDEVTNKPISELYEKESSESTNKHQPPIPDNDGFDKKCDEDASVDVVTMQQVPKQLVSVQSEIETNKTADITDKPSGIVNADDNDSGVEKPSVDEITMKEVRVQRFIRPSVESFVETNKTADITDEPSCVSEIDDNRNTSEEYHTSDESWVKVSDVSMNDEILKQVGSNNHPVKDNGNDFSLKLLPLHSFTVASAPIIANNDNIISSYAKETDRQTVDSKTSLPHGKATITDSTLKEPTTVNVITYIHTSTDTTIPSQSIVSTEAALATPLSTTSSPDKQARKTASPKTAEAFPANAHLLEDMASVSTPIQKQVPCSDEEPLRHEERTSSEQNLSDVKVDSPETSIRDDLSVVSQHVPHSPENQKILNVQSNDEEQQIVPFIDHPETVTVTEDTGPSYINNTVEQVTPKDGDVKGQLEAVFPMQARTDEEPSIVNKTDENQENFFPVDYKSSHLGETIESTIDTLPNIGELPKKDINALHPDYVNHEGREQPNVFSQSDAPEQRYVTEEPIDTLYISDTLLPQDISYPFEVLGNTDPSTTNIQQFEKPSLLSELAAAEDEIAKDLAFEQTAKKLQMSINPDETTISQSKDIQDSTNFSENADHFPTPSLGNNNSEGMLRSSTPLVSGRLQSYSGGFDVNKKGDFTPDNNPCLVTPNSTSSYSDFLSIINDGERTLSNLENMNGEDLTLTSKENPSFEAITISTSHLHDNNGNKSSPLLGKKDSRFSDVNSIGKNPSPTDSYLEEADLGLHEFIKRTQKCMETMIEIMTLVNKNNNEQYPHDDEVLTAKIVCSLFFMIFP